MSDADDSQFDDSTVDYDESLDDEQGPPHSHASAHNTKTQHDDDDEDESYLDEEDDINVQHEYSEMPLPSTISAPIGSSSSAHAAAQHLDALLSESMHDNEYEEGIEHDEDVDDMVARERGKDNTMELYEEKEQRNAANSYDTDRSDAHAAAAAAAAAHDAQHGAADHGEHDDDGDDDGDEEDDDDYEDDEDDDDEDEEELRSVDDIQRAKEEREHLIEINKIRQRQIAYILEKEKNNKNNNKNEEKSNSDAQNPEQIRLDYIKTLENLNHVWDELESKREDAEEKIDRLTSKLDAQDSKATELADSFKAFKREIIKEARFSRNGKPIKLKRILAFEAAEEMKEREVARVRLRHINLLNELSHLESAMKQKEKLAEGLHLIDFEQLKIENQTLNEKIEERNDEVQKLKKKTTTTVQVLTHIKEKLQFISEENTTLQQELNTLITQVQSMRDALTKAKQSRDEIRHENIILKQKQGFIGSDLLVADFENRKGEIELLTDKVDALKQRWNYLHELTQRAAAYEKNNNSLNKTKKRSSNNDMNASWNKTQFAAVKFGK